MSNLEQAIETLYPALRSRMTDEDARAFAAGVKLADTGHKQILKDIGIKVICRLAAKYDGPMS